MHLKSEVIIEELNQENLEGIVSYWTKSDANYLTSLGVDLNKLPSANNLRAMLLDQVNKSDDQRQSMAFIAKTDDVAFGHCNVNEIVYGKHAKLHLHIWSSFHRKKNLGTEMVRKCIPCFFSRLKLEKLYCEPYAENLAPNKTLIKLGFNFIEQYTGVPGSICFEQLVNKYCLNKEDFLSESN
ncbi:MAG TPA: GNAT family protein [Bacteroidia bacterium]|nr:GNAT family protein [Bacteroidia bacterium]HNT80405.1 GNAT family protein [Bacteroidia bacterium]